MRVRTIKIFDSKNYSNEWNKFKRDSVRAIIFCDNNLVMIRSEKFGEYKFPGGGIETGESHLDDGYETEYGYKPVCVSLTEAIEQNTMRLNVPGILWVERELFVLCELQKQLSLNKLSLG